MNNQQDRVNFLPEPKLCFRYVLHLFAIEPTRCEGCRFSHDETNLLYICRLLDGAEKTIDICMNVLTLDVIVKILIKAHKRGVKVRGITCSRKSDIKDKFHMLQSAGICVKRNNQTNFMHNKFVIIDSTRVIHGSANYSLGAFEENNETIKIENDELIVKRFQDNFDLLWSEFRDSIILPGVVLARTRRNTT